MNCNGNRRWTNRLQMQKQSMDLGVQSTRTNKARNYVREMNRNQWIITTRNTFK